VVVLGASPVLALVFAAMAPAILLVRRHEVPATFRH
jgi:hypothetical protein